jgi:hypothetical protein
MRSVSAPALWERPIYATTYIYLHILTPYDFPVFKLIQIDTVTLPPATRVLYYYTENLLGIVLMYETREEGLLSWVVGVGWSVQPDHGYDH